MQTDINKINWRGYTAFSMENEGLRVVLVPETGGRIVSIFDKIHAREWLLSPEQSHPTRCLNYGADFNTLTPGGWDEMFPTILSGLYPAPGKYNAVPLPDHGEVWTLPWAVEINAQQLTLSVSGRALPYRFERRLSLVGARELSLDYTLTNLADEPLHYLWTAHPQFACTPGCQIILPPQVRQVVNALPQERNAEWGPKDSINAWPASIKADGQMKSQDIVRSPEMRTGRKFYILPDQLINWAALSDPHTGASLQMQWDAAANPYFGVWIDEGSLNQFASVAFEPASGYYDSITLAWDNQRLAMLPSGGTRTWKVSLTFNDSSAKSRF